MLRSEYGYEVPGLGDTEEEDKSNFWTYWKKVKGYIMDLATLPKKVWNLRRRAGVIREWASEVENPTPEIEEAKEQANEVVAWAHEVIPIARKAQKKVEKYLPEWKSEANAMRMESGAGLGAFSVILTVVGMGALTYVAVHGMRILKEYGDRKAVVEALESGIMSGAEASKALVAQAGEAKGLKARFFGGMLGTTGGIVGMGVGALFIYWLFKKTVKKDVKQVKQSLKIS